MALFRALESQRAPHKRLFNDPFARYFLSASHLLVLHLARISVLYSLLTAYIDHRWPGARTSGVARTRLIDDEVASALASGMQQIAFLGAGFDSRAYRLPGMEKVEIFEVDHPATSARKRKVIRKALGMVPRNVNFVEIEFNRDDLQTKMKQAGFDMKQRTLFIWEGVTNYLSAEAVEATLRWCSQTGPESKVIFTYVDKKVLTNPGSFYGTKSVSKVLQDAQEKWTFGIDPDGLASWLIKRGLLLQKDIGATQYRTLYLGRAGAKIRGYEFYHLATASPTPKIEVGIEH